MAYQWENYLTTTNCTWNTLYTAGSRMSGSRLQLDVRNLSLGMRHLVNAYEVEAGTVRCNLQVTLCDPYMSALSVRYYNKGAI